VRRTFDEAWDDYKRQIESVREDFFSGKKTKTQSLKRLELIKSDYEKERDQGGFILVL